MSPQDLFSQHYIATSEELKGAADAYERKRQRRERQVPWIRAGLGVLAVLLLRAQAYAFEAHLSPFWGILMFLTLTVCVIGAVVLALGQDFGLEPDDSAQPLFGDEAKELLAMCEDCSEVRQYVAQVNAVRELCFGDFSLACDMAHNSATSKSGAAALQKLKAITAA
ncbi:hypothetical protein [Ramlibacter alkalitolerans]|uniref:SMODS and SLOG-associating 2TM effector domain-containing protein n=1 Tax=Ramlibacter alkalitolerans TaxID=2039631 RepID=A0ABS1JTY6_9BURK|nr:hypothetical protein [Ramlibacter alkalitolerans]MBL0427667.1 hypothetical protein [Ramlibacter alkalitolerans]